MPSVSYKNTVTIQTRFKITLLHPPPQAAPAARHRRPACRSPAPRRRPWHRPSSPSTPPAAKAPGKEVEKICGCVMKLWTVNIHLLFLTYYPLLSLTIPCYPLLSLTIQVGMETFGWGLETYLIMISLSWDCLGLFGGGKQAPARLAIWEPFIEISTQYVFTVLFLQKFCNLTCSKSVLLQDFNIGEGVSSNLVCDPNEHLRITLNQSGSNG